MKRCSKCGEEKELSDFRAPRPCGRQASSICKRCTRTRENERRRERRRADPDYRQKECIRSRKRFAKAQSDPNKRAQRLLRAASWREANPEKVKEIARRDNAKSTKRKGDWKRASYAACPVVAANRRAKTTLAAAMGVPLQLIPAELIEAKAAQLLVRRFIRKGK